MSYGYIQSKVDHMKRLGLVAGASMGRGKNGGACPDWLRKEQKDAEESRSATEHGRVIKRLMDGWTA